MTELTRKFMVAGLPDETGQYYELIATFPPSEPIVAMCTWATRSFVATSRRVYEIKGGALWPLDIVAGPVDNPHVANP